MKKKFNLQVYDKLFEIKITEVLQDICATYAVYECVDKKHWWSIGKKYLFSSCVIAGGKVKEDIVESIKEHLSLKAFNDNFLKQIDEL